MKSWNNRLTKLLSRLDNQIKSVFDVDTGSECDSKRI